MNGSIPAASSCTLLNPGADADLSAPHPSEDHIQIRIQMYGMHPPLLLPPPPSMSLVDNLSSLTALLCALNDLDALFETIEDAYNASLQHDDIEIWDEKR